LAPAPLDPPAAGRLIDGLRGAALFGPLRGAPARDRTALAELLARLSAFAADFADEVAEVDLNPVLVHEEGKGVTVVDALIVRRQETSEGA
jgi:acetyltransferase